MRFLSLFAGIGGFDLGLERAGMECVGQVENDPYCVRVLEKHWPDVPRWGDIKDVTAETLAHHDFRYQPKKEEIRSRWDGVGPRDKERGTGATTTAIELICGGFPCQPWSAAGKRGGTEDDRDLWPEMLRIIEIVRPNWVIGENVRGFVSMEMGLDRSISDLEGLGYAVQPFVIPACAIDSRHRRDRVWVVANAQRERGPGGMLHAGDKLQTRPGRAADTPGAGGEGQPTMADAAGSGRGKGDKNTGGPSKGTGAQREWGRSTNGGAELPAAERGGDVADAVSNGNRRPDRLGRGKRKQKETLRDGGEGRRQKDGFWLPEPDVGRVAHGIPHRVDRLRSLGNAVVPQVVERIGCAILESEGIM